MTWNYRILDHGDHLALHEVQYDEAGQRSSYTSNAVTFVPNPGYAGEIVSALAMALADAKSRPVLAVTDIGGQTGPVTQANIIARAVAFGATEAAARAWLGRPLAGYDGQSPGDLIACGRGNLVLQAINAVDASVFS